MPGPDPSMGRSSISTDEARTWGLFVLLSLIWGSSYLFIKLALDEGIAPLTLVSVRTLLGATLLGAVWWLRKGRLPRARGPWFDISVVGLTNVVVPYALITWGQLYITSGIAGILTALVPLFAVILASIVLRDEPITAVRVGGIAIGFAGVVLLAVPSLGVAGESADGILSLAGMAAVGLAAFSYAIAAVWARHRLTGRRIIHGADGSERSLTSLEISFGQVLVAAIVISAAALLFERGEGGLFALPSSETAIFAMLWLGALGTGAAYLLYFAIIGRWGATRATLIAYVLPIVAVVLGFLVLDERLAPLELVGTVLIIGGIVLVNSRRGQRPAAAAAAS